MPKTHRDSIDAIITRYDELHLHIFQQRSTVEDIDELFSLFTDDFTYVQPRYGGTYTRQIFTKDIKTIRQTARTMGLSWT